MRSGLNRDREPPRRDEVGLRRAARAAVSGILRPDHLCIIIISHEKGVVRNGRRGKGLPRFITITIQLDKFGRRHPPATEPNVEPAPEGAEQCLAVRKLTIDSALLHAGRLGNQPIAERCDVAPPQDVGYFRQDPLACRGGLIGTEQRAIGAPLQWCP